MIDSTLMNFFFSRSEMVENNPNVPLAVEAMDEQAYASHLAGRHAAVATLSHTVVDYPGKKMLLEQAIKVEKDASDALRTLANVTITAGAANEELTIERRNAMMVRSRQNLFSARQLFLSVKSKLIMRITILQFVLSFSFNFCRIRCRLRGVRRSWGRRSPLPGPEKIARGRLQEEAGRREFRCLGWRQETRISIPLHGSGWG